MTRTRTRTRIAFALAVLVTATVLVGTPVSAGPPDDADHIPACNNYASNTLAYIDVCIYNDREHGRYGTITYRETGGYSAWVDGAIGLERCQVGNPPKNCSYPGFTSDGAGVAPYGYFAITSDTVSASYGWIFRACGDMNDHRAHDSGGDRLCSPWMAGDPKDSSDIVGEIPTIKIQHG